MRVKLSNAEAALLAAFAVLLAIAVAAPGISQPASQHDFADQRELWGVPQAMDVLSNLAFAVVALGGAWRVGRIPRGGLGAMDRALVALFLAGLLATAAGSCWYHLQPDDAGLAVDRLAMGIAFAGLLGLAAAGHVSERAGAALAIAVLLAAQLAVWTWSATGNVLPWALVQFGGMALILWLAALPAHPGALHVRWLAVLLAYGVAKVCELGDHAIYDATGRFVSGHTLKHVIAAGAALPVLLAMDAAALSARDLRAAGQPP